MIGAASLAQGGAWAEATLGAAVPLGGAHPDMATCNRLARLPAGYLEIIAVDPSQTATRPRWYGLDDPALQARLSARPRPIAWVLATADIEAAATRAGWDVGEIVSARRGDLSWRIAVRPDGAAAEGVLPALIEWPESLGRQAPRERMADLGLALGALTLRHPEPARIEGLLASLDAAAAAAAAGFALIVAEGETPSLEAALRSPRIDRSV